MAILAVLIPLVMLVVLLAMGRYEDLMLPWLYEERERPGSTEDSGKTAAADESDAVPATVVLEGVAAAVAHVVTKPPPIPVRAAARAPAAPPRRPASPLRPPSAARPVARPARLAARRPGVRGV
ncbi:hypothetical protein [Streptomyces sp. NPDC058045]|uniref:hypothetical protein n=1 Tax=Streptomyces sp. NPDC058045 TaxID=3346311 RepID=UPI0036ED1654